MDDRYYLVMKNIWKSFSGVHALQDVDFKLQRGEIHALIGENGAGKSTLMKILAGQHAPDKGEIALDGKDVVFKNPADAIDHGITMIHQEICLVPTFSVTENIWLGRERLFSNGGLINKGAQRRATRELLDRLGIRVNPRAIVNSLSIANMQLVEIAKAISYNSDIIIMDEPTSALTENEIRHLFDVVKDLSTTGVAIIFISHKLEEIFQICDTITVFRDGKNVGSDRKDNISKDKLISMIVGRELTNLYPKKTVEIGDNALEVRDLSCKGVFRNVSFSVRKGEILGFYGLLGAGRTEIMEAVFGLKHYDSGMILIGGKQIKINSVPRAMKHGLGMVTEDRLRTGLIHLLSIKYNASIAYLRVICNRLSMIKKSRETRDFMRVADLVNLKYESANQPITSLSGGNQQKVVIARWLLTDPKVLVLDEPTRGIDVGSKSEIHQIIGDLVENGVSILLISSELPELLGVSDRILVVRNGAIVAEFDAEDATQEAVVEKAYGELGDTDRRRSYES
jgi:ABC-type sugar transport system ATPase subunit